MNDDSNCTSLCCHSQSSHPNDAAWRIRPRAGGARVASAAYFTRRAAHGQHGGRAGGSTSARSGVERGARAQPAAARRCRLPVAAPGHADAGRAIRRQTGRQAHAARRPHHSNAATRTARIQPQRIGFLRCTHCRRLTARCTRSKGARVGQQRQFGGRGLSLRGGGPQRRCSRRSKCDWRHERTDSFPRYHARHAAPIAGAARSGRGCHGWRWRWGGKAAARRRISSDERTLSSHPHRSCGSH